ncbi:MAG: calcium/sodium antiporter [Dehalococcoidia bacterium]
MTLDLVRVVVGLILLLAGAWLTVRSAASLAASFGISRVVIGATVVAFGTSAPEFVVSLLAASRESSDIAVGNVLGSNVANVALVLGLSAAIAPVGVNQRLVRWEIPVLIAGTALTIAFAASGRIGHIEGSVMFLGLIAFVAISPRLWPEAAAAIEAEAAEAARQLTPSTTARLTEGGMLVAGLAALTFGADTAVNGAVGIAERAGLSQAAIGATIVATGTSLPELATSAVAAFRREHEIAVANVVGSNIFNLLGVLGLTSALVTMPFDQELFQFEVPALAISTLILVPLAWPRYHISRIEGVVLLVLYVVFIQGVLLRGV